MEQLETGIKNLEELTNNLELQMENTRRKKYLKQASLSTIDKKLVKKKSRIGGSA